MIAFGSYVSVFVTGAFELQWVKTIPELDISG